MAGVVTPISILASAITIALADKDQETTRILVAAARHINGLDCHCYTTKYWDPEQTKAWLPRVGWW